MKDGRVVDIMTRDRWEEIKSSIHFVDNSQLHELDKIAIIRPFVEHLKSKFKEIPMTTDLCVDESIIPFKGQSSIKQYNPKKPHKWGYKFFVLADKEGIVYDFNPYCGKIESVDDPTIPNLGPSQMQFYIWLNVYPMEMVIGYFMTIGLHLCNCKST